MGRRALPRGLALAATVGAGLVLAPAAGAATGPCVIGEPSGPTCEIWTGKVGPVDDGDTLNARIGGARKLSKIRLTGVQAMELHSYSRKNGRSGECNAVRATERLERIVRAGGSVVRIAAQDPSSTTGERGRLRRSIAVRRGKRWLDVGAVLLREGLALWFPNGAEWAWNRSYSRLAEQAATRRRGIWNPTSCGVGPAQPSPLGLKVKWDAEDNDAQNFNGEWVRITNADPVEEVSLRGWWFRDSHLRRYTFGRDAVVPAGGSVQLHVGRGTDDHDTFHWGLRESVFENTTEDAHQIGDGGYLFDPQGDLRAYVQYPCRTTCREPLAGKVEVRAAYTAPEVVTVRNVSHETIRLDGYEVESVPWFYEFAPDTLLGPGEALRLWTGAAPLKSRLVRGWGHGAYLLADKADAVTLRNPLGAPVACDAWGGERCPTV